MGTLIKIEFRDRDILKINQALTGLEEVYRREMLMPAMAEGGEILRRGVESRIPKDSGVAAQALEVRTWSDPKRHLVGATVVYNTRKIKRNAPKSAKYPEGFFYPATIEYGSQPLNRVPIAPMRRTEEGDRPAAINAVVTRVLALSADLTTSILNGV